MLRNIIVPLDTSPQSELAAWKAGALARASSAAVIVVHVYEPPFEAVDGKKVIDVDLLASDRADHERRARRVVDEIKRRFECRCTLRMLGGRPSDAIVEFARNADADLIVMTTQGRTGMRRVWFGSVADTLARESTVPVLMVRGAAGSGPAAAREQRVAFRRVLVALDGSRAAEGVLDSVRALRFSGDTEVWLVQVVTPVPLPMLGYPDAVMLSGMPRDDDATAGLAAGADKYLARVARTFRGKASGKVETKVIVGVSAGAAIVDAARELAADLVALTSHGRGASRLIVGSVADTTLRGTDCSVLLRLAAPAAVHTGGVEPSPPACAV